MRYQWLTLLLLPILVFSVLSALGQVRDVPRRTDALVWTIDNLNTLSTGDYADTSLKLRPGEQAKLVVYTRADVEQDRLETTVDAQPGEVITRPAVHRADARHPGRQGRRALGQPVPTTGWPPRWFLALRVDDDATPGKAHLTVREARTLPIVAGRIVSLLGLLGLAAVAVAIVRGRHRAPVGDPRLRHVHVARPGHREQVAVRPRPRRSPVPPKPGAPTRGSSA